jgi:hypothetical protein
MAFYGRPLLYGYNPAFAYPIFKTENKLGGLFNEYNKLNDLSAKNNAIYIQNLLQDTKRNRNRDFVIMPPPPSISVLNSINETRGCYYPSNPYITPYSPLYSRPSPYFNPYFF